MNSLQPIKQVRLSKLADYIDCVRYYSFDSNAATVQHTILPEGYIEMIFQFGNRIGYRSNIDSEWIELPTAFIGGLHNKSFTIKTRNDSRFISICFRLGKAKYIIPKHLNELKNRSVPIGNIFGSDIFGLIRSLSLDSKSQQTNLLEDFLFSNLDVTRYSTIEDSVEYVQMKKGIVTVKSLADRAHLSISQFRNRFGREVGIGPKQFCRIARINSLIKDYIDPEQTMTLTELSHCYEYFDQSHFIHDFKSITSNPPKKYLESLIQ